MAKTPAAKPDADTGAEMAKTPAGDGPGADRPVQDPLPASVTLASPYGFYDDAGQGRFWSPGQVVTDPSDVALLIERGAPLLEQAAA